MVDKLNHLGYDLSVDDIFQNVQLVQSAHGRPHVAQALVTKGLFPSVKAVFDELLHHNGPAYVPHLNCLCRKQSAQFTAGGLAIVVYPGLIEAEASLRAALASGRRDRGFSSAAQFGADQPVQCIGEGKQWLVSGAVIANAIPGRYPLKPGVFAIPAECQVSFGAIGIAEMRRLQKMDVVAFVGPSGTGKSQGRLLLPTTAAPMQLLMMGCYK